MLGQRRTFGNLATFFPATARRRSPSGWATSSTTRSPGTTSPGCAIAGRASSSSRESSTQTMRAARQPPASMASIVSNHGGRQLDGATSTIARVAAHRRGAAGRCEVLLDGGIHCGQSVLKALALGARACIIGRSYLYGLAALGERGVALALEILRREFEVSMALTGTATPAMWIARYWCRTSAGSATGNRRGPETGDGKDDVAATCNGSADRSTGPGTRNGFTAHARPRDFGLGIGAPAMHESRRRDQDHAADDAHGADDQHNVPGSWPQASGAVQAAASS